jgi:hypothetical protein
MSAALEKNRPIAPMVMPIVGMKMIGSVAPVLTAGAAGVVVEILLLALASWPWPLKQPPQR